MYYFCLPLSLKNSPSYLYLTCIVVLSQVLINEYPGTINIFLTFRYISSIALCRLFPEPFRGCLLFSGLYSWISSICCGLLSLFYLRIIFVPVHGVVIFFICYFLYSVTRIQCPLWLYLHMLIS